MLTSYAQNFEDVILWRALKHVERGFYIDIGAQDPIIDSVSLAFYEKGWRGVHVEPVAAYARKLREARPDEEVIEAAIAEHAGTIEFWEFNDTGLSTGDRAIAERHQGEGRECRPSAVPCMPLSALVERYRDREVHWLKIDVEGMEAQVVAGWEPSGVRPWIVVVESTRPNSPEATHAGWEPALVKLGYDFVYFDGLNRFYLSRDHPELRTCFGPGPNVFDGFVLAAVAERDRVVAELRARTGEFEARHAAQAEALAERDRVVAELAARVAETEAWIAQLHRSTSWRVTTPLRSLKRTAHWFATGAWAWLTLKPGSRPRRTAGRIVRRVRFVTVSPDPWQHRRRQAENPLIGPSEFPEPPLPVPLAAAAPATGMMAGTGIGDDTTPWTRHMLSRLMAARAGRGGLA